MSAPPTLPQFLAEWYPHLDPEALDDLTPEILDRLLTGYTMMALFIAEHEAGGVQ